MRNHLQKLFQLDFGSLYMPNCHKNYESVKKIGGKKTVINNYATGTGLLRLGLA